ncbi:hypothetical protein FQN60_009505 [Etheostoma spectabile]|uniref:Uncharacterized protein n=1 Tax=Etheostoma spectabile TaxID=54343 RepID=A0A5J5DJJ2_9PERO|nr:hypothetical protein FQN60_009505 [Etheostoma spectabile]
MMILPGKQQPSGRQTLENRPTVLEVYLMHSTGTSFLTFSIAFKQMVFSDTNRTGSLTFSKRLLFSAPALPANTQLSLCFTDLIKVLPMLTNTSVISFVILPQSTTKYAHFTIKTDLWSNNIRCSTADASNAMVVYFLVALTSPVEKYFHAPVQKTSCDICGVFCPDFIKGTITACADADITVVDLRCTEARGSTSIILLLFFKTCQHSKLVIIISMQSQTAKQQTYLIAFTANKVILRLGLIPPPTFALNLIFSHLHLLLVTLALPSFGSQDKPGQIEQERYSAVGRAAAKERIAVEKSINELSEHVHSFCEDNASPSFSQKVHIFFCCCFLLSCSLSIHSRCEPHLLFGALYFLERLYLES